MRRYVVKGGMHFKKLSSQPTFNRPKLTIEALKQFAKYVQS